MFPLIVYGFWFAGVVRWPWSPQGCPLYPTTCDPKLRTDHPPPATTGGSGSATNTHRHTVKARTEQDTGRNYLDCNALLIVCVFVFANSLMVRRVLPVYTPATACPRRKLPAITGRTLELQPSLCQGPLSRQVPPLINNPLILFCLLVFFPPP